MVASEKNGNGGKLIEYQMRQFERTLNDGLKKIDDHLIQQDSRINDLYIWRAGIEAKTLNINHGLSSKDLGKIILAIIAALTLALTILSQNLK